MGVAENRELATPPLLPAQSDYSVGTLITPSTTRRFRWVHDPTSANTRRN